MLKLSKLADYGAIILSVMAPNPAQLQSAGEIAAATQVPVTTVSKILKMLARAGLLVSQRGAHGGYSLARPPAQISIAQIIAAMDGPIGLTECSVTPGLCAQEAGCRVRPHWQRVNRAVLQALQQVTLDQMILPTAEQRDVNTIRFERHPTKKAAVSSLRNGETQ